VTWWDRALGAALALLIGLVLQLAWLGESWSDAWIAAGCWFVVALVGIEVRRRLSRADRESRRSE